jgi:seryl-tRNA synthetase
MFDIKFFRENEQEARLALGRRCSELKLDELCAVDRERRRIVTEVEALKQQRNIASEEIGRQKKEGADTTGQQNAIKALGGKISELDRLLREKDEQLEKLLLFIPNMPHSSVPDGKGSQDNVVVRTEGKSRAFDFKPRTHLEIAENLGIIDFERAGRLSKAGFPLFVGSGAKLERALIRFMIDLHVKEHGYLEVSPPFVCNSSAMTGTGQLPKMAEDMYSIPADDLYLIPTAEVPVTNIYREEIIARPLPIKLVAYSPCFRREAGAAGKETRGLIRVHQFDKVEMVKFVEPDTSYAELDALVDNAEDVLRSLGLAYRVVALCAGDLSFAASKCYDIELWAPGQNAWLEVSSCSNFESFQARRAGIRWRNGKRKVEFVHTLNGSGVALARLVVAILENCQLADGSVELPEAIVPYMDGTRRLEKADAAARL